MGRLFGATVVCLAMSVSGGSLRADETAKSHFNRGVTEYALGNYAIAAEEYEQAFKLRRDPALLYNAAQAHRLAGHTDRALLLYQSYLALFPVTPAMREEVTKRIVSLREEAAKPPVKDVAVSTKTKPSDSSLRDPWASERAAKTSDGGTATTTSTAPKRSSVK